MEQGQRTRIYLAAYKDYNRYTPHLSHTDTYRNFHTELCACVRCGITYSLPSCLHTSLFVDFVSGQRHALQIKFPCKNTTNFFVCFFYFFFFAVYFPFFYIVCFSCHHCQIFASCCTPSARKNKKIK